MHIKKIQQKLQNLNFTQRLLVLSMGLMCALLLGLGILINQSFQQLSADALNKYATTLLAQTARLGAEPLATKDLVSLNVILEELNQHPEIPSAAIYNSNNQLLAERGISQYPLQGKHPDYQVFSSAITYNDDLIGQLRLSLSQKPLASAQRSLLVKYTLLSIMALIGIGAILYLWANAIRSSLQQANDALKEFPGPSPYKTPDHSALAELNQQHQLIEQIYHQHITEVQLKEALHRFTSPLQLQDAKHNSELPEDYSHVAMLYIDILNFHDVRHKVESKELTALLNTYYFYIQQACKLYNGKVENFHGDGVMVLFGIPHEDSNDNFHAVCAGQLLIEILQQFNAQRIEQHLPIIQFQFGIHSGRTLISAMQKNNKLSYSVMGDNVNLAARVSRQAPLNKLSITHKVLQASDLEDRIHFEEASCVFQGDTELTTYTVQSLNDEYETLLQQQSQHIISMTIADHV